MRSKQWKCVIECGTVLMNRYGGIGDTRFDAARQAVDLMVEDQDPCDGEQLSNVTIHFDTIS